MIWKNLMKAGPMLIEQNDEANASADAAAMMFFEYLAIVFAVPKKDSDSSS